MRSIWQQISGLPDFPAQTQDEKTDVLIIGGGLTGLLCAHMLRQEGVSCLVVEAEEIFGGTSGHTTAKITSQHGLIYSKLLRRFGKERSRLYLEANEAALAQYRLLCKAFPCDFEVRDNYVYSLDRKDKLIEELDALQTLGFPAEYAKKLPLPIKTAGAVRFPGQGQFNPQKFAARISKNLNIRQHTRVLSFDGKKYLTDRGHITAEKVIVATHFPLFNKHGFYFAKLYQHRSYVLALEGCGGLQGMYVDESGTGLSFRDYQGTLLLGGGAHRTGKTGGCWQELELFAEKHYPNASVTARWAAQDCMSLDGIPYIGPYSPAMPNVYVATGFNKWGMSSAMVSATVLTDLVQDRENPYASVFSPRRSLLRPQLFVNLLETSKNLLTYSEPRCPHMGCALKWNPQEHSWDCACHGSRFSEDGILLDNPANGDLDNG